jgi:hypothetical protein
MADKTWKSWTDEDDKFMIENYKNMIVKDICLKLVRNKNSILNRARILGLSKSRKDTDFNEYISFKRRKEAGLLNETKIEKVERQNANKIRWATKHPERKFEVQKKYKDKYYANNYDKIDARNKAERLIKLDKSCNICGSEDNLQRHHWRYDKPLLVNTLCLFCHDVQHGRGEQYRR